MPRARGHPRQVRVGQLDQAGPCKHVTADRLGVLGRGLVTASRPWPPSSLTFAVHRRPRPQPPPRPFQLAQLQVRDPAGQLAGHREVRDGQPDPHRSPVPAHLLVPAPAQLGVYRYRAGLGFLDGLAERLHQGPGIRRCAATGWPAPPLPASLALARTLTVNSTISGLASTVASPRTITVGAAAAEPRDLLPGIRDSLGPARPVLGTLRNLCSAATPLREAVLISWPAAGQTRRSVCVSRQRQRSASAAGEVATLVPCFQAAPASPCVHTEGSKENAVLKTGLHPGRGGHHRRVRGPGVRAWPWRRTLSASHPRKFHRAVPSLRPGSRPRCPRTETSIPTGWHGRPAERGQRWHGGDVLISNFNNARNVQGTGTTIVQVAPDGTASQFARITPASLPEPCPGGIGLTTALEILNGGWVVVGSLPTSHGGTVLTGTGCLLVLNSMGRVVETFTGHGINGPWDMAVVQGRPRSPNCSSPTCSTARWRSGRRDRAPRSPWSG